MNHASIHRFREKVAVYLGNGDTIYLSARDAEMLAQKLDDCATDIHNRSFQNSEFGTFSMELDG